MFARTRSEPGLSEQKKENVWQIRGKQAWEVLNKLANDKLTTASVYKKRREVVWDNGHVHEIDFKTMSTLPTRAKLKFGPVPTAQEVASKKQEEERIRFERRRAQEASEIKAREIAASKFDDEGIAKGLEAMVHPAFLDLKICFNFRPPGQHVVSNREYAWERTLADCEDPSQFLAALVDIVAEVLDWEEPEIPTLGNPQQTMAALALGMSLAGAVRTGPKSKFWYFTRHIHHTALPIRKRYYEESIKMPASPAASTGPGAGHATTIQQATRRPSTAGAVTGRRNAIVDTSRDFPINNDRGSYRQSNAVPAEHWSEMPALLSQAERGARTVGSMNENVVGAPPSLRRPQSAGALTRSPGHTPPAMVQRPQSAGAVTRSPAHTPPSNAMVQRPQSAGALTRLPANKPQFDQRSNGSRPGSASSTSSAPALKKQEAPPMSVSSICFRLEDTPKDRTLALTLTKTWQRWQEFAKAHQRKPPRLGKFDDSYDYLMIPCGEDALRMRRLGGVSTTGCRIAEIASQKDYRQLLNIMPELQNKAHIYGKDITVYQLGSRPSQTSLDNALRLQADGVKVALMMICEHDKVGGPIFEGAYNGMEGDACMRSDLYCYLREAQYQAEHGNHIADYRGWPCGIPQDGAIVLSDVCFFRDSWDTGYAELARPVDLHHVICISLLNLNPYQASDAAARAQVKRRKEVQKLELFMSKFLIVLLAACKAKVEVLCVSDQDCEKRLHVDPFLLGKALGRAIQLSRRELPKIEISGSTHFVRGVRQYANSQSTN